MVNGGFKLPEKKVVTRQNLIVEDAESRANRGLAALERVPRHADAWTEIPERRVAVPRRSDRERTIGHPPQVRNLAVDFGRNGDEFVANAEIDREVRLRAIVVLEEEPEEALPIPAHRIDLAGNSEIGTEGHATQEVLEAIEGDNAALLRGCVLVELHPLAFTAKADAVRALRPEHRIVPLIIVQIIIARQPEIARGLGHDTGDGEVAEGLLREPVEFPGNLDRADIGGLRHRTRVAQAQRIDQRRSEDVLFLKRQILIARALLGCVDRRLRGHLADDVAVRKGEASKQRILVGNSVIDATLREVFIGGLRVVELVFRESAAEVASIGHGEKGGQILRHQRMDLELRTSRKDAAARVGIGNVGEPGDAQALDQRLKSPEKEGLLAPDGSPKHASELVALERRNLSRGGVEEILGIHRGIPVKVEQRSIEFVGSGSCHGIENTTGRPSEFRRISIGHHHEFAHGFDTQQHARHRSRSLVIDIVDVRAIEQEAGSFGAGAIDRDFRSASTHDVVAGGGESDDAGLQHRELLKRTSVERQVAHLALVDESGEGSADEVDRADVFGDGDGAVGASDFQAEIDESVLADGESDALANGGLEALRRGADLVAARQQLRFAIASFRVGGEGPRDIGFGVADFDGCVGNCGSSGIEDGSLKAGSCCLRPHRIAQNQ